SFYLEGWMKGRGSPISRLGIIAPDGQRIELLDTAWQRPRPDVDRFYGPPSAGAPAAGFISYFSLHRAPPPGAPWGLSVGAASGAVTARSVARRLPDPVAARDLVFRNFRVPVPPADALEAAHLLPAIARLQARHQASVRVEECLQYGSPPPAP